MYDRGQAGRSKKDAKFKRMGLLAPLSAERRRSELCMVEQLSSTTAILSPTLCDDHEIPQCMMNE